MHLRHTFMAAAVSAALILSAAPAHAQRRGGGGGQASHRSDGNQGHRSDGNHQSQGRAVPRAQPRAESTPDRINRAAPSPHLNEAAPAPRLNQAAPRSNWGGPAPRFEPFDRRNAAPRAQAVTPYRGSYEAHGAYRGSYDARGAYRADGGHRYDYGRSRYYRGYRGGYGYYGYRPGYGSHYTFFSYYLFRPRISLGFGLWAGYPIVYPDYYGYYTPDVYITPEPYPSDSYAYGTQPPPSSCDYQAEPPEDQGDASEASAPGGLSFDITPASAAIFVDGTYVGTASMFAPSGQPLGLIPGRHHIEVRAEGYRTMAFDADVTPGQVVPYRGTLQR